MVDLLCLRCHEGIVMTLPNDDNAPALLVRHKPYLASRLRVHRNIMRQRNAEVAFDHLFAPRQCSHSQKAEK